MWNRQSSSYPLIAPWEKLLNLSAGCGLPRILLFIFFVPMGAEGILRCVVDADVHKYKDVPAILQLTPEEADRQD